MGARAAMAVMVVLLSVGCVHEVKPEEATPLATATPADCNKTTGYDVIIVGAGMSGLTAAKELRRGKPDINVLILEATDRIGGRAKTLKNGPPIDLGGAWLHGVSTNQLTGIVDAMGFKRVTTRLESPVFTEQGRLDDQSTHEFWTLHELFEAVYGQAARNQMTLEACKELSHSATPEKLTELKVKDWDQLKLMQQLCTYFQSRQKSKMQSDTISDYLPNTQNEGAKAMIAANAGPLESAVEVGNVSTVDAAEFEAEDDALLEKGLGNFVEAYGQGVPVCLNSPVTGITYRDGGVVVEVAGGKRFEGHKALVTVSTGVLKANKIRFDPALPQAKLDAIDKLPMGNLQKVIIDFKDQEQSLLEKDANSWVLYVDSHNAAMAFVIRPLNKNIVIGFYGGDQAKSYEGQCSAAAGEKLLPPERQPCDKDAVERAQTALGKMYTPEVAQAVDKADIYVTRWSLDPWTLGAYSAAAPGSYVSEGAEEPSAREQLAKPISYQKDAQEGAPHQVFFAGEACSSPMYNGSLAGAYESGLKAARLMLEELRSCAP